MRGNHWLVFALPPTLALGAQDRRVAPAGAGSRRRALVIGNNAYPWKPLTNAVNDAKALAALLPRLGFQPGDITVVTDTSLRHSSAPPANFWKSCGPTMWRWSTIPATASNSGAGTS